MAVVSVIIPVHNKWDLTRNCLISLAKHTPPEALEVIMVDNASSDETPTHASALGNELFPGAFHMLRQERNINFGPASNEGAHHASTDLLFFLNNDTLATEGWLSPLLEALQDPTCAGVGPLLLYPNDTVQHLGIIITPPGEGIGHLYVNLPAAHPLVRKKRTFPCITAAALLLRKRDFQEAEGFYPGFVNGFEDVDLCLGMLHGSKQFQVEPRSVFYHLESQTPNRHSADLGNSNLLTSRRDLKKYSNMEKVIGQDGYQVDVTINLDALPTPKTERLPALRAAMLGPNGTIDPAKAAATLRDEPLWENGYLLAGQAMADQGLTEEACRLLYHALLLTPGLRSVDLILKLARKLPPGPMKAAFLQDLGPLYDKYVAQIQNEAEYTAKLSAAVTALESIGNQTMAARYRKAGQEAAAFRHRAG